MNASGGKDGGNGGGFDDDFGGGFGNGFDDPFDDLIKDADAEPWDEPGLGYDPYSEFPPPRGGGERATVDALTRVFELLAGAAGDALPPEARRQLERVLRDLLVTLRDSLDRVIERLDGHVHEEVEIEEIPID